MFVFKQQSTRNSESSGSQHVPHDIGERLSHDSGEHTSHSGMCALELKISIMILSIYFLTYTYKISYFHGHVCSSSS